MGLLDKFIKNKEQENIQYEPKELPFEVEVKMLNDELIQIDFFDKKADFKQFYDTTRLVASYNPTSLGNNRDVINCKVSWFGHNDAQMLYEGKEIGRRVEYRGVLAQIDLNLLQTDANYCYTVMKGLLNKERVEKYLDRGLEENPTEPCGKYIGGIIVKDGKYGKSFDPYIGRESHFSNLMVNRRREYRENQEKRRQQQIDEKRRQMEQLQGEIDRLEGR